MDGGVCSASQLVACRSTDRFRPAAAQETVGAASRSGLCAPRILAAGVRNRHGRIGLTNVEAARAAVRGLTRDIPVFEKDGKLYGRLTVDAIQSA